MKIVITTFLLVLLFPMVQFAQQLSVNDTIENMIIYTNERAGIGIAHSAGLGLGYRAGRNLSVFNTRVLGLDIVSLGSNKQIKVINPYYSNSKRYVYGKLNDVFVLNVNYGHKYQLNRKPYWGGVEVRWLWEAGASIAFEKPYYLFVININQTPQGDLGYTIDTQKFDDDVSWDDIYGRAPFTKGLNEIRPVPGVFGKLGFNFEFGNVKTSIRAAEIGSTVLFYPQGIKLMDDERSQSIFINFYIGYIIGKRFNKY